MQTTTIGKLAFKLSSQGAKVRGSCGAKVVVQKLWCKSCGAKVVAKVPRCKGSSHSSQGAEVSQGAKVQGAKVVAIVVKVQR